MQLLRDIRFCTTATLTQIYLPAKAEGSDSWDTLSDCFEDVKSWMANNFLQLNESKSEILFSGQSRPSTISGLGSLSANGKPQVRNLGVILIQC